MKTFKDLIDEKLTPAELEESTWSVHYDFGPHMSNEIKVKATSKEEAKKKAPSVASKKHGHENIMINHAKLIKESEELDESYKKHSTLANLYDKEMKYFKDKGDRKKMATSAIKAHTRAHTTAPNDAKKEYHKKRIDQYNSILKESEEIEEGSAFDKNMNDRARGLLHKLKDTGKKLIAPVKDPILDKMKELDAEVRKRTANESEELSEARIKPLPRRHFFDTYGNNNGIAYTDNKNWWKIMDGKVVGYANSYEDTSDWKKEFVAIQKGVKESEELEELNKTTLGSFIKKATKSVSSLDSKAKDIGFNDAGDKVFDKARKREKSIDKAVDRLTKESENIDEAMVDSWKKVQSMDKGSVLGNKEQVKKRLDYLNAVHAHHKKYGNDTKKVRADIEKINRSRLAEETEELTEMDKSAKQPGKDGKVSHKTYGSRDNGDDFKGPEAEAKPITSSKAKKDALDALAKSFTKESVEIEEAAQSGNKGNGYHGQFPEDQADAKFSAMHTKLKKKFGEEGHLKDVKKPNVMIKHFLDSTHGRHVAAEGDSTVVSRFKNFKRNYKPELHEAEELEEGKHEGTIAAIAKHAYSPEVGHKIVTKKGGQVPGTVEKIEKDHVYFRHPEGKLFRTHVSNVQKDGK